LCGDGAFLVLESLSFLTIFVRSLLSASAFLPSPSFVLDQTNPTSNPHHAFRIVPQESQKPRQVTCRISSPLSSQHNLTSSGSHYIVRQCPAGFFLRFLPQLSLEISFYFRCTTKQWIQRFFEQSLAEREHNFSQVYILHHNQILPATSPFESHRSQRCVKHTFYASTAPTASSCLLRSAQRPHVLPSR
jgi:hypothetical protein